MCCATNDILQEKVTEKSTLCYLSSIIMVIMFSSIIMVIMFSTVQGIELKLVTFQLMVLPGVAAGFANMSNRFTRLVSL